MRVANRCKHQHTQRPYAIIIQRQPTNELTAIRRLQAIGMQLEPFSVLNLRRWRSRNCLSFQSNLLMQSGTMATCWQSLKRMRSWSIQRSILLGNRASRRSKEAPRTSLISATMTRTVIINIWTTTTLDIDMKCWSSWGRVALAQL